MNEKKLTDPILITKASGEQVPFAPEKLKHSLRRSGANQEVIKKIEAKIQHLLYPGISTKEIYRMAFSLLKKSSRHTAAKYKLKKAIMELGPSGFPFEKYVSEILKYEGYKVLVGQIVQGHCVQHEVDVIAQKDEKHFMIECKFHGDQGRKCDVKIPLYIQSRFLDVEKTWQQHLQHTNKFHQGWVVTNTRFTADALRFGTCAGLYLLSWNFPSKNSLKERIDSSGLHPLTSLTTLTKGEKKALLERGFVLCKELCQNENWLEEINIEANRRKKILAEASLLCETKIHS